MGGASRRNDDVKLCHGHEKFGAETETSVVIVVVNIWVKLVLERERWRMKIRKWQR